MGRPDEPTVRRGRKLVDIIEVVVPRRQDFAFFDIILILGQM